MRCQRCQFENVPGESRCLKCGSILSPDSVAVDIHPPRMVKWKGPFRAAGRWFRLHRILLENSVRIPAPAFLKIMSADAYLSIVVSIIPGLAHILEGRFREVRWFVLAWFSAICAGIFFYGNTLGLTLLGVAVGLHGWIAFEHTLSKERIEISRKFFIFVMLLAVIGLLYWGIRRIAFRDFVFGFSNLTVPYQNVEQGDLMLARRSRVQANLLTRGSLVITSLRGAGGHGARWGGGAMVVQIVGLPGENIEFTDTAFIINGKPLKNEQFPVPPWLRERNIPAISIPEGSYFINAVYNVHGRGAVNAGMVGNVCLVKISGIQAKAVMRWFPLARRGFLRSNE